MNADAIDAWIDEALSDALAEDRAMDRLIEWESRFTTALEAEEDEHGKR